MNIRCWNCGQDQEVVITNEMLRSAYDHGYRKGMDDIRKKFEDYRLNAEREDGQ